MNSPKIAIFGLGVMGSPMSQNIAKKGYQTFGYNRTSDRPLVREAAKAGVEVVSSIDHLGIASELMIDVCNSGAAASWALANLAPKMAQADFTPGFMVKHILKDLRLVQEAAQSGDLLCDLPGVTLAEQLLKSVQALGGSEQGSQAIVRAYREL